MGRRLVFALLASAGLTGTGAAAGIVWPTPNQAYFEGRPFAAFVQPTQSGKPESGLFGCVRSEGHQFHEGLDLFPLRRDRRGEALDPVFAILPGVVRYACTRSGLSNYGRYVVIEHDGEKPAILSLYAHLGEVAPEIRAGARVEAGQTLGVMGRSAMGYTIPKERAHLHLETGLWLSRRFPEWYAAKGFQSRNEHGLFNGMNIVAFDFLDYLDRRRAGQVRGFADYLLRQPTAVTVAVRSTDTPDFVERHPELLRAPARAGEVAGWRVEFTWFGLPKAWWPLTPADAAASRGGRVEIVFHDPALLERHACHGMVRRVKGRILPGSRLEENLAILFR